MVPLDEISPLLRISPVGMQRILYGDQVRDLETVVDALSLEQLSRRPLLTAA